MIKKSFFIFLLLLTLGCQKQPDTQKRCANWNAANLVHAAKQEVELALQSINSDNQIIHAKKGLMWSQRCIENFPAESGCYYLRALARGLYHEKAPLNYQKGLKQIVADSQKLLQLDPSYENAGAYRILGNVYLKVPSFALSRKSITKDPEMALDFARKAFALFPNDTGNQLLLAEALIGNDLPKEALPLLKKLSLYWTQLETQLKNQSGKLKHDDQKNLETTRKLITKIEKRLTK